MKRPGRIRKQKRTAWTPDRSAKRSGRDKTERLKKRISSHIATFNRTLANYEKNHPNWRAQTLLWVIDYSLRSLRHYIESRADSEVTWTSPFVELHYPVEWNWRAWGDGDKVGISVTSGTLTEENTVDKKTAVKTLGQIMVKHLIVVVLQDLTNQVAFEKRGSSYTPIISTNIGQVLQTIKGAKAKQRFLEELFHPFSIGATRLDFDVDSLKPNARIPKAMARELARKTAMIDLPALELDGNINGKELKISVILQVSPLIFDIESKRAHFPITIGLMLGPKSATTDQYLEPPTWADPSTWSVADRTAFWEGLFKAFADYSKQLDPTPPPEIAEAVVTLTAKLKIPISRTDSTALNGAIQKMTKSFAKTGQIVQLDVHVDDPGQSLPAAEPDELKKLLVEVETATDHDAKGKALERLAAALFGTVPGFEVLERVRTETEEIDLSISNNSHEPWLAREGAIILGECKNWSDRCGKNEFVSFREKLLNRKGRCSLGFLVSWNGFADTVTKEMLRGSREGALVVPLDGAQIRRAVETSSFLKVLNAAWQTAIAL